VKQRDARGAVGVVLDVRDLRRHAVLVMATEVDDAVGVLADPEGGADRTPGGAAAGRVRQVWSGPS